MKVKTRRNRADKNVLDITKVCEVSQCTIKIFNQIFRARILFERSFVLASRTTKLLQSENMFMFSSSMVFAVYISSFSRPSARDVEV